MDADDCRRTTEHARGLALYFTLADRLSRLDGIPAALFILYQLDALRSAPPTGVYRPPELPGAVLQGPGLLDSHVQHALLRNFQRSSIAGVCVPGCESIELQHRRAVVLPGGDVHSSYCSG